MPLKIHKDERESSQNLIRRFSRRVKQSGILVRARKNRFQQRPKSPALKKKSALRREELKKEYLYKEKMSKPK